MLRPKHERAALIQRTADDALACLFFDRQRFPGEHGLVDAAASFDEGAVDRDFFARLDAQEVAYFDFVQFDLDVLAVANDEGAGGRQGEQLADGASRFALRAQFQDLAEQDQGDDHGGRLEISADFAVRIA